ncbi:MAG TPA: phosphoribosylformylglycinamidine synthase subunit PurQ [Gemmatimonadaceae bacterium]|nr:phosphoribosylformylglycinamidine synthase subunit PurQ [Gemmatimonadaceae bacterium]HZO20212.1 phosphoribosylformylglycinamidine synthase subunit PurQ [Gemmatimonadaceae bacterium]
MKFGIVTFPGSNCDYDAYHAVIDQLGERAVYLWHKSRDLEGVDVVILPGGFSYGDYLRAGAIARFSPIMHEVASHARRGGPVIGICNGFQILCEAHLLPGALMRNSGLKFVSKPVHLRVENTDTLFTHRYEPGQVLRMPIAHGEGRYVADRATLERLDNEGRVVFRYVDAHGGLTAEANPNGSLHAIAGIVSAEGNVLGMMPHPERAVEPILGSVDGLGIFHSVLERVAA